MMVYVANPLYDADWKMKTEDEFFKAFEDRDMAIS